MRAKVDSKITRKAGHDSVLRKQRQVDFYGFEVSLVFIVSFRTAKDA